MQLESAEHAFAHIVRLGPAMHPQPQRDVEQDRKRDRPMQDDRDGCVALVGVGHRCCLNLTPGQDVSTSLAQPCVNSVSITIWTSLPANEPHWFTPHWLRSITPCAEKPIATAPPRTMS